MSVWSFHLKQYSHLCYMMAPQRLQLHACTVIHLHLRPSCTLQARKLRQTDGGAEGEEGGRRAGASARDGVSAGRHVVDFDSLSFNQGGHFMANRSCQLPQGSYRCAASMLHCAWHLCVPWLILQLICCPVLRLSNLPCQSVVHVR